MKRLAALAGLALLAAAPQPAAAQCSGATCTVTIQLPVNTIMRMTLSSITTPLGNPTAADFVTGYKDVTGPSVTVKANRSWQVNVVAASGTFSFASKPASDLLWGPTAGPYPNNAGTAATLATGVATAGSTPVFIYFRTNWFFGTNPPGVYDLMVNYTVSAP